MFEILFENKNGKIININDGFNYLLIDFDGFNPPSASLYTSKSPNRKGSKKNGSTLDERALIFQIKLLGDIEENRNALYEWTDTETELKIHYKNGVKKVYCEGTVTDCDVPICTDNEIMTVAITCTDPYLKEMQEIATGISTVFKQFTFPFAISKERTFSVPVKRLMTSVKNVDTEKTTDTYETSATGAIAFNAGIPFSTIRKDSKTNIFNAGAETGALIRIKALAEVSKITLYDANDTTKKFKFKDAFMLAQNEIIEIDTERSPRTVRLIRTNGQVENILRYVEHNPTWFQLKKGDNLFNFTASDINNVEVTFSFTNKYLGA